MNDENAEIAEAYSAFAQVYDTFMDNVPYEQWCGYLVSLLKTHGVEDGLVLELGCGTGRMTRLLEKAGYDMIGVDASEDMLAVARENSPDDILYLQQDMREFELYGTVRAVVSVCDCMNYITEPEELEKVFSLVNNYLDPGGIFIFDMNTLYKYRDILGQRTIAEDRDDCSFIWNNTFYEEDMLNEYDLTLFIREESGLFRRYRETHCQRAYTAGEVCSALERSGLKTQAVYDAFTRDEPGPQSERICFAASECTKKMKMEE